MRKFICLVLIIIYFLFNQQGHSQTWPRIFGQDVTAWARDLKETYDHGYLLLGQVNPGPSVPQVYSWLIKTDINGVQIWDKKMFNLLYQIGGYKMERTSDHGLIIAGSTTSLDQSNYDAFFIKLNVCGEKEWCKIFSTPGNSEYGLKIIQVQDGYIALVKYFQDWKQKRIWLFKLDDAGDPVWQKLYAQTDPNLINEECRDLTVTSDGGYLITGDGYYYDSVLTMWRLRPLMIKTDADGNEQWNLFYGLSSGFRGDVAQCPTEGPTGQYYCSARHFRDSIPTGDSPCFLKFDAAGNEVYYGDLVDSTKLGMSNTLNFINDSVMLIAGGWSHHTNICDSNGIIKTDTLGNVLKKKVLLANVVNTYRAAVVTSDDKYLVTGGFSVNGALPHIYLYKLNFNLDFDSIYTMPRVYDSLCPHPIVSDTTDLDDCGVVTSLKEPEEYEEDARLRVYPNPATDRVTVEIPQVLIRKSAGRGITTTIYHQWEKTRLDVFNLNGNLMFSQEVDHNQTRVHINTSGWPQGMYLARLVFMNEVVAGEKLVISVKN